MVLCVVLLKAFCLLHFYRCVFIPGCTQSFSAQQLHRNFNSSGDGFNEHGPRILKATPCETFRWRRKNRQGERYNYTEEELIMKKKSGIKRKMQYLKYIETDETYMMFQECYSSLIIFLQEHIMNCVFLLYGTITAAVMGNESKLSSNQNEAFQGTGYQTLYIYF